MPSQSAFGKRRFWITVSSIKGQSLLNSHQQYQGPGEANRLGGKWQLEDPFESGWLDGLELPSTILALSFESWELPSASTSVSSATFKKIWEGEKKSLEQHPNPCDQDPASTTSVINDPSLDWSLIIPPTLQGHTFSHALPLQTFDMGAWMDNRPSHSCNGLT